MARSGDPAEVRDGVELRNLDAELFVPREREVPPGAGATERDLVDHLGALSGPLVAKLRVRPLTVLRVRPGQRPLVRENLPASAQEWIATKDVRAEASGRQVHRALDGAGLAAAVKTSGAEGLHVVVPVRDLPPDDAAAATRARAARAEQVDPATGDPWRDALPAPQVVPEELVVQGRAIPPPRMAAMHQGRRRASARRAAPGGAAGGAEG